MYEVFEERTKRLQERMVEEGVDAFLVLGGVAILDGDEMVRVVGEGGSGYFFAGYAEKTVLVR
ncbi:MAG: hypothetical protein WBB22_04415 [Anaerolineae bacterium]